MFQGWVERWPMSWDYNGSYAQVTPDVVDSFAVLSQTILKAPFYLDVLALSPAFFFPLNDPAPSTNFVDITNTYAPAPAVSSPYGAGVVASGSSLTSTGGVALTNEFLGAPGPVVSIANSNTGSPSNYAACSCIQLAPVGIAGPPVTGGWTRMIAFNNSGAGGAGAQVGMLWYATNAGWDASQMDVGVQFGTGALAGQVAVFVDGPTAGSVYHSGTGIYNDGNWHLLFFSLSANGLTFNVYIDGVNVYTNSTATTQVPGQIIYDNIGAIFHSPDQYNSGYNGYVAHAAQFNYPLTLAQIQGLYASWRTAWNGDTAQNRYLRILKWAGYTGLSSVDTTATTNMGPATDLIPTNDGGGNLTTSGTDALTALTNVVITENGNHFMDANGVLQFRARTARYQPFVAQVTFGENTGSGEIPYEDVQFDFDTTQVGNDCQITRNYTSQVYFAEGIAGSPVNPGSQARFGVRTLQRTVNTNGLTEPQDAANFFLYRYGLADVRISSIVVHVSALYGAVPTAWGQMLGLELGSMVTVNRRAPGDPVITWNGFVESIKWDLKAPRDAFVTLQLSPADKYQFWLNSALYGTLNAQATAGASTATINPLPDSATNAAKCSFPAGQTVQFEPLTARSEIAVVLSITGGSPGYTSAIMNLDRNLAFTHALGSTWIGYESTMTGQAFANIEGRPSYYDAYAKVGQTTIPAY